MSRGIIVKALSGFYYVFDESNAKTYECRARGAFRKNDNSPLVGDRVEYSDLSNGKGVVNEILNRKNMLVRPPVSNIDRLFIVVATSEPKPNTFVIDKVIMNAENSGIEPIIIINKCDIASGDELEAVYNKAGFETICVSANLNDNIDLIKPLIKGHTVAFTGNTGVGKSSIINALDSSLNIDTGIISKKLGRGRHTTRHVELYPCCDGFIADTPGFSSFDMEKCGFVRKENVQLCFREFEPYIMNCKFTGCSHTKEKGCAVINALQNGEISQSRFDSYCRFYEESSLIPDWQIDKMK